MKIPVVFRSLLRHSVLVVLYALVGLLCGAVSFLYFYVDGLPELNSWHKTELNQDFSTAADTTARSLQQYLQLEDKLFEELQQKIYLKQGRDQLTNFSRYKAKGQLDPTHYRRNWNRSQYLLSDRPRAAFLLLHGLSDSPYSLRKLAQTLQQKNCDVLALRLPGHGTLPSGLASVSAEDFKQAVRIGARALRARLEPEIPLYIVGYSNGATLALDYALAQLEGEDLPVIAGMVMISPAISVSEFAAFAAWQRRLSAVPGLDKLAWHSIQPEYDPYKYNSFTLNAAKQIYHLTRDIQSRLQQLQINHQLEQFPPVLAFMSAVDATVSVPAVMNNFLARLPGNNHQLVLYDINREQYSAFLFAQSTQQLTTQLLQQPLPFSLTLLSNASDESAQLIAIEKPAGSTTITETPTTLSWPSGIFSLSHVALPFSPADPIYGDGSLENPGEKQPQQSLGSIHLRGERGVLRIPDGQLIRLRFNPFYQWQEAKILKFVDLQSDASLSDRGVKDNH